MTIFVKTKFLFRFILVSENRHIFCKSEVAQHEILESRIYLYRYMCNRKQRRHPYFLRLLSPGKIQNDQLKVNF